MELVKDKPRTLQDINQEYSKLCFEYGSREYKTRIMKQEMEQLIVKINALDAEAAAISQQKKADAPTEEAATEAPLTPPEPVNG